MKKYRKKYKKLFIILQVVAIWYAMVLSVSLVTTNTAAYFSDKNTATTEITTAPYWWDKSELKFIGKNTQNVKECALHEISVEIKNIGSDMTGETEYEVLYTDKGNPSNPHGQKVAEGKFGPLSENEIFELSHEAQEDGFYKFKAFQRDGFKDNYDKRVEIWSEKVHLNCNAAKKADEEVEEETDEAEELEEDKENKNDNKKDKKEKDENKKGKGSDDKVSTSESNEEKKDDEEVNQIDDEKAEEESVDEAKDSEAKKKEDESKNKDKNEETETEKEVNKGTGEKEKNTHPEVEEGEEDEKDNESKNN